VIPVSDEDAVRKKLFPLINLALIAINIIVFVYELSLPRRQLEAFVAAFGVTPFEIVTGRDIPPPVPGPAWLTLLTAMFIHGGLLHIAGNMLYLWIFGDNVEDAMGHLRYLIFYLLCGLIASLAQVLSDPLSRVPSVGASGAIAGVLGAYVVMFPRARIRTLLFIGPFFTIGRVPALLVIGLWAVIQLFAGIASLGVPTQQTGGVAYFAHIGGFFAGVSLVWLFRRR
jgi:membrane associated rhomboid family serine protease